MDTVYQIQLYLCHTEGNKHSSPPVDYAVIRVTWCAVSFYCYNGASWAGVPELPGSFLRSCSLARCLPACAGA